MLFDTHTHLNVKQFEKDEAEVIGVPVYWWYRRLPHLRNDIRFQEEGQV